MVDSGTTSLISAADTSSLPALSEQSKSARDTPEAMKKAATQFEALLIGEILKSAREGAACGWMGTDEDEAGSTLMDVSEQQVSQALASGGGIGLAKMISAGLSASAHHMSQKAGPAETR
jgi:flagellar protein FlgJ